MKSSACSNGTVSSVVEWITKKGVPSAERRAASFFGTMAPASKSRKTFAMRIVPGLKRAGRPLFSGSESLSSRGKIGVAGLFYHGGYCGTGSAPHHRCSAHGPAVQDRLFRVDSSVL